MLRTKKNRKNGILKNNKMKRHKSIVFTFPKKRLIRWKYQENAEEVCQSGNNTGIPPYSHEPDGIALMQNFRIFYL